MGGVSATWTQAGTLLTCLGHLGEGVGLLKDRKTPMIPGYITDEVF